MPAARSRPVGPNGFARFGAIVLALLLVPAGICLTAVAISLTFSAAVNEASSALVGSDLIALPWMEWRIPMLIGGALLLLLGALTARLSGTGAAVTGVLTVLSGIVALIWPTMVGDWLSSVIAMPEGNGLDAAYVAIIGAGVSVLGIIAIAVGAILLAVAGTVHGARRAGWERGRGN